MAKVRRLEAPWSIEVGASTFTVRTANGFVVATIYHDDEPQRQFNLRHEEARRVAVAISRLPDLLAMEKALKAGEPGEDDDLGDV
jgi:hypothetical protein